MYATEDGRMRRWPQHPFQMSASILCRVIALAWKKLDAELTPSQITALSREEIESGLTFGGFAVFHCPLKEDSEPALRMLKVSACLFPSLCTIPILDQTYQIRLDPFTPFATLPSATP